MTKCSTKFGLLAAMVIALGAADAVAATHKSTAKLFGSPWMRGHATYREKTGSSQQDQWFNVHVSRALPLQTLEVTVNGQPVGVIVTNGAGNGKLHLRTGGKGSADPLPDGFPSVGTGDVVGVGPLTGVCFDKGHNGKYELEGETVVNGAQYEAEYKERMRNGVLEREFEAQIEGGEISQDVPIFINDVFFGVVTTDEFGNGEIELSSRPDDDDDDGDGVSDEQLMPADFPSLQAGDVVRIGNTFVTLGSGDDDGDDDDGDDDGDDGDGD